MRILTLKPRHPICEKYKTEKPDYQEYLIPRIHYLIITFGLKWNVIILKTENKIIAFMLETERDTISFPKSEDLKVHENQDKMITHSAALNGTINLRIWRYMKFRTKMKTHSAALNPQIWGSEDTWKSRPKWKTIQLLLMWLKIC